MGIEIDLLGQKFTRWLVIDKDDNVNYCGHIMWKCLCDCGAQKIVSGSMLRANKSKSCGCLSEERKKLSKGESGLNRLFDNYKRRARIKNLKFSLTKKQFKKLTSQNCYYCNTPPVTSISIPSKIKESIEHSKYLYNGIDRQNNNLGYVNKNCVSCCKKCNTAKMDSSYKEFIEHILKIASNIKRDYK